MATATAEPTATNGNNPLKGKGLDNAAIIALMGRGRARNAYVPKLEAFINSDEPAVEVAVAWPEFSAKQATTLYQGFRNALTKAGIPEGEILVKQDDGHVYLMHVARVNALDLTNVEG